VVVVVHEAGHFFAAKSMGMRVKEFAFGFPPRLFSFIKGETKYSFNLVPLGGYVLIDGETGAETTPDPKLFTNKSKGAQAWVMFAGPLMNIVLAFVLMSISFMVGYGNNKSQTIILATEPNNPAEVVGLQAGDRIYSIYKENYIDPTYNPDIDLFRSIIAKNNGSPVTVEVERGKEIKNFYITPVKNGDDYKIGVSLGKLEAKKLGFFPSIVEGFKTTIQMTWETIAGFGKLIGGLFTGGNVKASLTGPVGIAKQVTTASDFGFAYLLSFIALISVNLGVLNLFPFPALDGGRLLFLLIEKIKGSRINPKVGNIINIIGFGLLILLMVIITIKDVIKLFNK